MGVRKETGPPHTASWDGEETFENPKDLGAPDSGERGQRNKVKPGKRRGRVRGNLEASLEIQAPGQGPKDHMNSPTGPTKREVMQK